MAGGLVSGEQWTLTSAESDLSNQLQIVVDYISEKNPTPHIAFCYFLYMLFLGFAEGQIL